MLTVVTPAASFQLTTLDRARDFLGFAPAEDVRADACIDQASRAIADHCRRPFGLETVRETLRDAELGNTVLLARSPVTAFVSVTADGEILASGAYTFDGATGRLCRADAAGWPWWPGGSLIVEYSAGYVLPGNANPTLPEPVERAAILLAGVYLSTAGRDPLIKSESVEGVGSTTWGMPGSDGALASAEAEGLLQPYRRLFP